MGCSGSKPAGRAVEATSKDVKIDTDPEKPDTTTSVSNPILVYHEEQERLAKLRAEKQEAKAKAIAAAGGSSSGREGSKSTSIRREPSSSREDLSRTKSSFHKTGYEAGWSSCSNAGNGSAKASSTGSDDPAGNGIASSKLKGDSVEAVPAACIDEGLTSVDVPLDPDAEAQQAPAAAMASNAPNAAEVTMQGSNEAASAATGAHV